MLDAFIVAQRGEIISRTKSRVRSRTGPKSDLPQGIPIFLDQLVSALRLADSTDTSDHEQIRTSAAKQGEALLNLDLNIEEVVHEYGDVCQTITALAIEHKASVPTDEFRVMNMCLDDAIAQAVTQFASHGQPAPEHSRSGAFAKLAHEMRTLLSGATTSFAIIKRGQVAASGTTGMVLERNLAALGLLLDRLATDS